MLFLFVLCECATVVAMENLYSRWAANCVCLLIVFIFILRQSTTRQSLECHPSVLTAIRQYDNRIQMRNDAKRNYALSASDRTGAGFLAGAGTSSACTF